MPIDVSCDHCGAVFRVKDEWAGRTARCKHCGQAFRIPDESSVEALDDDSEAQRLAAEEERRAAEEEEALRRIAEAEERGPGDDFGIEISSGPDEAQTSYDDVQGPLLPPEIAQRWLPIAMIVLGYGLGGWLLVDKVLHSHGPTAGLLLIAGGVIAYLALAIPMTIRGLEGAARTARFSLPNTIWLQTSAALAVPTLGGVLGLVAGGWMGAIWGVGLGLALMIPLMMLMYDVSIGKAIGVGLSGGMNYLMAVIGSGVVLALIAIFVFPRLHMSTPWREYVAVEPKVEPKVVAVKPVEEPTTAPVVEAAPTTTVAPVVVAPVELKPIWVPVIDAGPRAPKAVLDVRQVIDVIPPVSVAASADGGCVAVIDADSAKVYELRSGRRLGVIKEKFNAADALVSKSGKFLVGRRKAAGGIGGPEVWQIADARMLTPFAELANLQAIGFADDMRLVTQNAAGAGVQIRVWDVPSAQKIGDFAMDEPGVCALGSGGKYLAHVSASKVQICDLASGKVLSTANWKGETLPRAVRFSNDGTALAALAGTPPAARLVVWEMTSGNVVQDAPLPPSTASTGGSPAEMLRWLPDDSSLIVGMDLVDRATGKAYHRLIPPAAPNYLVRPRMMMSNYIAVYESVPLTATKLSYKSTPLPRGEIDAALKTVRGPDWKPAPEVATTAPGVFLSAAEPVVKPQTPLKELVRLKQFTITVGIVRQPNIAAIDQQIEEDQKKLPEVHGRYVIAKQTSDRLESEYTNVPNRAGGTMRVLAHSQQEIGEARVAADRIRTEETKLNAHILRLQKEKKAAINSRTVSAKLQDDTVIELDCEGPAMIAAADGLMPASKVIVDGDARIVEGMLRVRPKKFTPAP